eukprot:scaffold77110_cov54-Phaeocystis_antarctica.AAC.1
METRQRLHLPSSDGLQSPQIMWPLRHCSKGGIVGLRHTCAKKRNARRRMRTCSRGARVPRG